MATVNHEGISEALSRLALADLTTLGKEALETRNYPLAHLFLQAALERERSAAHLSLYALAISHYSGETRTAISLCLEAVKKEPDNPDLYLRLGIVYLIAGRRKETVRILQLGLRAGKSPEIHQLLQILGSRRPPVLPFLRRNNPLNKYLGKVRSTLARAS